MITVFLLFFLLSKRKQIEKQHRDSIVCVIPVEIRRYNQLNKHVICFYDNVTSPNGPPNTDNEFT